jgi:hypothetical protein
LLPLVAQLEELLLLQLVHLLAVELGFYPFSPVLQQKIDW